MELKEFIKTAITDITNAVSELQVELENGAIVSPSMPSSITDKTVGVSGMNRLISYVDFDVAVVVETLNAVDGNAKAGIQVFSAKVNGVHEERSESVSRMSFSVPVIFPTADVRDDCKVEMEGNVTEAQRVVRDRNPRCSHPSLG